MFVFNTNGCARIYLDPSITQTYNTKLQSNSTDILNSSNFVNIVKNKYYKILGKLS